MIRKSKMKSTARWLVAAALVIPGLVTATSAGAVTLPWTPCWDEGLGDTCTGFDGAAAAAYADQYAFDANPNFPAYNDDCTNFVSQALYAGDHSYIAREGDPGANKVVDDDTEWWWFPGAKDLGVGRTYSWSVANDLWTFENVPVTQYPRPFVADPYSAIITGSSFWNNDLAYGTFISNEYMSSGNEVPEDSLGDPVTMSPGDLMFYDWQYSGDQYGDGFFGNHVAMVVSGDGVDPTSGWSGALVDEHSTNNQAPGSNGGRKDAIWSLIPYNSQYAATTAGWQDNDDAIEASSSANAADAVNDSSASTRKTLPTPDQGPALATPSSPSAQQAYSGTEKTDGSVSVNTAAAAKEAFQSAITSRQEIAVPPGSTPSSATHRPTEAVLSEMRSAGEGADRAQNRPGLGGKI
jgi:hypothetical protein